MSTRPHSTGVRRWITLLALQAGVLIAGLVALEVGARAWLWLRGEAYDAADTRREALRLLDLTHGVVPRYTRDDGFAQVTSPNRGEENVLHPYLGWDVAAGIEQIDRDYRRLRNGESANETPILIVGGSVAANFSFDASGWTRVRDTLRADPRLAARNLQLMSLARGGFKQPQQVNFLLYVLALGFEPRAVINIDGFNEVALGNNNRTEGAHPVFPSAAHWSHLVAWGAADWGLIDRLADIRETQGMIEWWASLIEDRRLERSCVLGRLVLHRLYKLRQTSVDQASAYGKYLAHRDSGTLLRGPTLAGSDEEAVEASVRCWKESSRCLNDICRARGIIYIHVLQPTLYDTGSKTLTAKEIDGGKLPKAWSDGVKLGYPLLREAGDELEQLGVDFIDATQIFHARTDDIYFDACHFLATGDALLADAIAPELAKRLLETE